MTTKLGQLEQEAVSLRRASEARFVGTGEPARVLVAGDVHGNAKWALALVKLARRYGASGILQVGDFWYFSHIEAGERYLNTLDQALAGAALWLLCSPGNHDNHALLARQPVRDE